MEVPADFALAETPRALPALAFEDADGQPRLLTDYKGKVVLLNLWATWCLPCRTEMPTLDRLQATLGGDVFQVVALSIDRKGPEAVRDFYAEIGVEQLDLLIDPSGRAASTLGAVGLPTTLLIDRQGREIGRLVGPAEWDAPEMIDFFQQVIAQPDDVPVTAPAMEQ
nr:TlpA disulfide reductase family protein [Geminicoccus roseus]